MSESPIDRLFQQARALSGSERDAFLSALSDESRRAVEELLAADESAQQRGLYEPIADGDLDPRLADTNVKPVPPGLEETDIQPQEPNELPKRIGNYKILQLIGEGGMGSVYMAEQTEPVKRRVALKVIKAGMDSKEVVARFESERQALAMMDHPHIAKVLDAGVTDDRRPYFVMEYVKGVAINRYCDDAKSSLPDRLQLFVQVCRAIQHAHHKGIIHRDLKPSNILICLYDGVPMAKVIDFGLAKAMHQPLTEKTLFTRHGLMVGTPLYMSPEQAEVNNLDVDTRTDIYSLGVVLYELLSGTTPLEREQLNSAAYNEILRLIKEVEPIRPSLRLSGSETLPSVAAQRNIDPRTLTQSLAGELDWIVLKALEKERSRRYDTANDLARDVERFLNDETVEATPPTFSYRLRKFTRRHRPQVIAAAMLLGTLLLGIAGTTWGLLKAQDSEQEALEALAEVKKERDAKNDALAAEKKQREATERELIEGILRPIGRDKADDDALHESELRSFVEWSRLSPRLKLKAMEQALCKPSSAIRIAMRRERIIQACIGLSSKRHQAVAKLLSGTQLDKEKDELVRVAACSIAMEIGSDIPAVEEYFQFLSEQDVCEYRFDLPAHHVRRLAAESDTFNWETLIDALNSGALKARLEQASDVQPWKNLFKFAPISCSLSTQQRQLRGVISTWRSAEVARVRNCAKIAIQRLFSSGRSLDDVNGAEQYVELLWAFRDDEIQLLFPLLTHLEETQISAILNTLNERVEKFGHDHLSAIMSACLSQTNGKPSQGTLQSVVSYYEDGKIHFSVLQGLLPRMDTDQRTSSIQRLVRASLGTQWQPVLPVKFFENIPADTFRSIHSFLIDHHLDKDSTSNYLRAALLCEVACVCTSEQRLKSWRAIVEMQRKFVPGIWADYELVMHPFVTQLSAQEKRRILPSVVELIRDRIEQYDSYQAFEALIDAANQKELDSIWATLLGEFVNAESDFRDIEVLTAIADRVSPESAQSGWTKLSALFEAPTHPDMRWRELTKTLGKLGTRLPKRKASDCWHTHINALRSRNPAESLLAAQVIRRLSPRISESELLPAWRALSEMVNNETEFSREDNDTVLAALSEIAARLPRDSIRELISEISESVRTRRWTYEVLQILARVCDEGGAIPLCDAAIKLDYTILISDVAPKLHADELARRATFLKRDLYHYFDRTSEDKATAIASVLARLNHRQAAECGELFLRFLLDLNATEFRAYDDDSRSGLGLLDSSFDIFRLLAIEISDAKLIARMLQHPGCIGLPRQFLLCRFEELILHDGEPILLTHACKQSEDMPFLGDGEKPETPKARRVFSSMNAVSNWIKVHWPDFDRETSLAVALPSSR